MHTLALRSCNLHPHAAATLASCAWPRLGLLDLRGNWLPAEEQARLRKKLGVRVRY